MATRPPITAPKLQIDWQNRVRRRTTDPLKRARCIYGPSCRRLAAIRWAGRTLPAAGEAHPVNSAVAASITSSARVQHPTSSEPGSTSNSAPPPSATREPSVTDTPPGSTRPPSAAVVPYGHRTGKCVPSSSIRTQHPRSSTAMVPSKSASAGVPSSVVATPAREPPTSNRVVDGDGATALVCGGMTVVLVQATSVAIPTAPQTATTISVRALRDTRHHVQSVLQAQRQCRER